MNVRDLEAEQQKEEDKVMLPSNVEIVFVACVETQDMLRLSAQGDSHQLMMDNRLTSSRMTRMISKEM